MKKILISFLTFSMLTSSILSSSVVSAKTQTQPEITKIEQKDLKDKNVSRRLPNGPSTYEYKTEEGLMSQYDLVDLQEKADAANNNNTNSDALSLASFIMSFLTGEAFAVVSQGLSGVAYMIKSDIDPYQTLSYAFTQYRFLQNNSQYTYAKTEFKLKRFFNGIAYTSDWYPTKSPKLIKFV